MLMKLLPQSLAIQNAYTEMCNGSKSVTVMVRNGMAYPQTPEEDPSSESGSSQLGA